MTNPNVQIPADRLLDPMLAELVSKLSMEKPNWFFRQVKNETGYNHAMRGGDKAPDGTRYIRDVDVIQDNRIAGRVSIEIEYRYRGEDRKNYVVSSTRIDNGRKRNKMTSTKVDVAVRNAKKYFDPPKTGEIIYEMQDLAGDRLGRALSGLKSYVGNGHVLRGSGSIVAQRYLHSVLTGAPVNPLHEAELRAAFCTTKFEEELSKYLLAESMSKRTYKTITVIEGDYCMFAEDVNYTSPEEANKAPVLSLSFEQLPEDYQNKVAVLQLMQDNEVVLDVGFRLSETTFLVVHNT